MAIPDTENRKRGPGRPRVGSTSVMVKLPPGDLAMLDTWIASHQKIELTRPEAIRRILRWALKGLES